MKGLLISLFLVLIPLKGVACVCAGPYEFSKKKDLKGYSFIAFVEIDSVYISAIVRISDNDTFYEASFRIIELFKGRPRKSILVNGANSSLRNGWTSCDIGIDTGEKWIVFGYKDKEDNLRTGYCTFSKMYANKFGEKDWQFERGIKELNQLRELYKYKKVEPEYKEGLNTTFYPTGEVEINQDFRDGLAEGSKLIYYRSGSIMVEESYKKGKKSGHSKWFDREGRITRDFKYLNGHPVDTCYYYWQFSGVVRFERIFDQHGNMLKDFRFNKEGVLKEITEIDYERDENTSTAYYDSGNIHYIVIHDNSTHEEIRTTEFFEFGGKEKEWIYYPKDRKRKYKYSEWVYNGDLYKSYILLSDGTRINLLK